MTQGITILSRLFWPDRFGGLEHVLWELSNALCDLGTPITVLAESSPSAELSRTGVHSPCEGIEVISQPPIEFGRLWRVGELLQIRWWMKALKQAPKGDVIWANEPTGAIAAIMSGYRDRLMYRPVFCYEALHHVAQTHTAMQGLARTRIARRLDRFAYQRAHWIIDESNNLAMQHTKHYGQRDNLHIIHNGTSAPQTLACTRKQFGIAPHDFVVGFVGRPGDPCKDLPFLIDAFSQIKNRESARLLIAGGGEGIETAKQWVNTSGLGAHCIWAGNLEDVSLAYRAMDVLVLPSRFETFGNVIVEAHAHGVPAIGRRFDADSPAPIYTASEELIEHAQTGMTVDPHDPADLTAALDALQAQPDLAATMGRRAAARMHENTWPNTARRYRDLLGIVDVAPSPALRTAA